MREGNNPIQNDEYHLPYDTKQVLLKVDLKHCKNLGLILDRYPPKSAIGNSEGKSKWFLNDIAPNDQKNKTPKTPNNHIDLQLLESIQRRWQYMIEAANAQRIEATLGWRMVIGLGSNTVLETSLTLHHLYGIPIIPGSALKGLTRAYVTGELQPSEKRKDDNDEVKRIFGAQKNAGTVIFFDALPHGKIAFAVDIMNAHYADYYESKKDLQPPTNEQKLNPATFLTVDHASFAFAVAPCDSDSTRHVDDAKLAAKWLQDALKLYGVGRKTSAGYGYFEDIKYFERVKLEITPPQVGKELLDEVKVVKDVAELRQKFQLEDASAFLQYKEYKTTDIVLVIGEEHEEARLWHGGDRRRCQVEQIDRRNNGIVVFCKPVQSKKKKK